MLAGCIMPNRETSLPKDDKLISAMKSPYNLRPLSQAESGPGETSTQPHYQQMKLAMDVHAASIVAVRMVDGAKPRPPQAFKPADFLGSVKKQVTLAKKVLSCLRSQANRFFMAQATDRPGGAQLCGLPHLPVRAAPRRGQ